METNIKKPIYLYILLILALGLTFIFPRLAAEAVTVTDNFNRADGNLGANWASTGSISILTNVLGDNGSTDTYAYWSANTFSADQFSQATITATTVQDNHALAVRMAAGAKTYYYCDAGQVHEIGKFVNGTITTLQSVAVTINTNDVLRCEVQGTTIRYIVNGATIATATDSAITSGSAGVFVSTSDGRFDDWSGGDLGGITPPPPPPGPAPTPPPVPTPAPTPPPGPGIPTLVQHVATGMDRYPVTKLHIPLPNPVGNGNALILGVQFHSTGSVSSVTDDKGNTWIAGPSTVNASKSQRMSLYYALNVIGGTQKIVVNFSGLNTTNGLPQAVISEFYNVAQASAIDGSSANSTSTSPGTITTTTSGDLIYHWSVDFSDTNSNGGAFNGTSIAAGPGFTLLSADNQVGSADQFLVQSGTGALNPTLTPSGSATWGSVGMALKSAAAGTPPPAGIRIIHIQHTLLNSVRAQNRAATTIMQFPSSGNLLVGSFNSADTLVSSMSDSAANTWVTAASTLGGGQNVAAQILYVANASTSPNLSNIRVTLNGTTHGDDMLNLYDITGASNSPFDKATTALGIQNSGGNLTTATLTPSTANGIIINDASIDFHTVNGIVGGGYILDTVFNEFDDADPTTGGTDVSTLDMDNGYAHVYNTTTATVTFVYTATGAQNGGVLNWGDVSAAFKAGAGSPDTTAPSTPNGLSANAISSSQINLNWTSSTDNVAVTGYKIFRGGIQIATSAANSYSDTGLTASTTYSYTVLAFDAAGNNSSQSTSASTTTQTAVTPPPPPPAPTPTPTPPPGPTPSFVTESHWGTDCPGGVQCNNATVTVNVTGSNNVLIAAWHTEWDGTGITQTSNSPGSWSINDNGVAGTLLVQTNGYTGGAGNGRFRIYYWVNPPSGTNTVNLVNSNSGQNEESMSVILLNNVSLSSPFGAPVLDVSTTPRTSENETVSSTSTTDLVVHVIADALCTRGALSAGETSLSVANDGVHCAAGDGDASVWIASKPGTSGTTAVGSSGWASGPSPSPRVLNGVAFAVHGSSGVATPLVGDINLDHIVNSIDYSILNGQWFTTNSQSDFNHDGIVNAIDFSMLNANWLKTW